MSGPRQPILGIHVDEYEGHAWISFTNIIGETTTYGLWASSYARNHGYDPDRFRSGDDIWMNLERHFSIGASRYYELTPAQRLQFYRFLYTGHDYYIAWYNCASFAENCVATVIGEDVDADSWFGIETPAELMESIEELEEDDPTGHLAPSKIKICEK